MSTAAAKVNESTDDPQDFVTALLDKAEAEENKEEDSNVRNCSFQSAPPCLWMPEDAAASAQKGRCASAELRTDEDISVFPIDKSKFEYPRVKSSPPEDAPMLQKLFIGNIRFEMTREALQWVFLHACKVDVPVKNILVHVKNGNYQQQQAPTGCASVFVDSERANLLKQYNQRIFCNAANMYVASNKDKMASLMNDRRVLDLDYKGRKLRGPKNAMVIETSRGNSMNNNSSLDPTAISPSQQSPIGSFSSAAQAGVNVNSFSNMPPLGNESFGSQGQQSGGSPFNSFAFSTDATSNNSNLWMSDVRCINYPFSKEGADEASASLNGSGTATSAAAATPAPLADAVELFVGGIRYEATETFVAWILRQGLSEGNVVAPSIHASHVTLFTTNRNTKKKKHHNAGCAIVRVEKQFVDRLLALSKCLLCVPHGVYVARTPQRMDAFIRDHHALLRGGPSHAVVIELRKNGSSHSSASTMMMRQGIPNQMQGQQASAAPGFSAYGNSSMPAGPLGGNSSFFYQGSGPLGNGSFSPAMMPPLPHQQHTGSSGGRSPQNPNVGGRSPGNSMHTSATASNNASFAGLYSGASLFGQMPEEEQAPMPSFLQGKKKKEQPPQ